MEVPHLPLAVLGLLALCWPDVWSFGNGAPLGVCGSMMPRHNGISPQTTPPPHIIYVNSTNHSVQVKIMGRTYKGILLQARTPNGTTAVGTWTNPPENTKAISCFNIQRSGITHSNTMDKNNHSTYTWIPSSENCVTEVRFLATVAESRAVYWLNLRSDVIRRTCSGCSVKTMSGFSVLALFMGWSLTG